MWRAGAAMNVAMVALSDIVGTDDPLDPATMRYKAAAAIPDRPDCSGCVFRGQRSKVCKEAARLALRAGLPDCDSGHIYVAVPIDSRQLTIV